MKVCLMQMFDAHSKKIILFKSILNQLQQIDVKLLVVL